MTKTSIGSTVISVRTELARKQPWCALSCIRASSSSAGASSPPKTTRGLSTTRVMASWPASFFSSQPTAASS